MNTDLQSKLEQEVCFLQISIPYNEEDHLITFDDGLMTELECDDDFVPPMFNDEDQLMEFVIDLKERKVIGWNANEYLRMWAKVRDGGTYTLLDANRQPIWQIRGYVPSKLIPPFEKGYGDYIELAVEAEGTIVDWPQTPDFSDFVENGKSPEPVRTNKWHRAEPALWYVRGLRLNKEELGWLVEQLKKL